MSFDLKQTEKSHLLNRDRDQQLEEYYQKNEREQFVRANEDEKEEQETAQRFSGKIIHQWEAPEFELYEKSTRWYLIAGSFLLALVAYGLVTNSPIMAITFILVGIVGYIQLQREPRILTFAITTDGVLAGKELYRYDIVSSFWIFYDPPHTKTISLHTKANMLPFVHIPIENQDPVLLRKLLMEYIPETKQDPGIIDAIERVLHI